MSYLGIPGPPSIEYLDDQAYLDRVKKQPLDLGGPTAPVAATAAERSHNPLRPNYLDEMIGQGRMKALLARLVQTAKAKAQPLDHMLLVGSSGMGKTTIAHVVANELGVKVFQVEAPVSHDTLVSLRSVMNDQDILFVDEIHQQGIMDRRSRDSSTQPEVLFSVMEDRTLVTGSGVLPFPSITVIGATTDEGRLPDAFINRFPIRPEFDPYTMVELAVMATENAAALGLQMTEHAALKFAYSCRGVPRVLNNYVKNAASLAPTMLIDVPLALEVVETLNRTTYDGLSKDMQKTLLFLYTKCRQRTGAGETVYRSGLGAIARAIGKSRDVKAVELRVEPYLIEQGYLQVGHGGRRLTDEGVKRAVELLNGGTV